MQSVIILGGDKRSRFLDTYFKENGFFTYCFGVDREVEISVLRETLQSNMAALILPLPASRDGKTVNMPLFAGALSLDTLRELLPAGQMVFGGMLSEQIQAQLTAVGARVIDYYDDEVIVQNAQLTAVGAMHVLKDMTDTAPAYLHIAVTGFGRVAAAVAAQLQANGCTATVAARRAEARADAQKAGCKACTIEALRENLSDFDIILNTVPARIFSAEAFKNAPNVQYIELASAPYGMDLEAAKAFGVTAVNAQSLPGKYLPYEAAHIVGEKIKSFL